MSNIAELKLKSNQSIGGGKFTSLTPSQRELCTHELAPAVAAGIIAHEKNGFFVIRDLSGRHRFEIVGGFLTVLCAAKLLSPSPRGPWWHTSPLTRSWALTALAMDAEKNRLQSVLAQYSAQPKETPSCK
jgi:hypothetical protein